MDGAPFGTYNLRNALFGGNKMKFNMYDDVKLNTELEELSEKGIHNGCLGIVLEIKNNECLVLFFNKLNRGDYACCNVDKKFLTVLNLNYKKYNDGWEKFKATRDLTKDSFKPQKFFEYDLVELTVEKEKYSKYGVHKGMQGVVMENYCIDSEYYVIFTDESTAEDIADLCVNEDDLILIWRNPDK